MAEALSVTSTQVAAGDSVIAVAYNFHGTRMACATAKRAIKVYNINEEGAMEFAGEIQPKVNSVGPALGETKLAWAHHELGQVVAATFAGLPVSLWAESAAPNKEWLPVSMPLSSRAVVRDMAFSAKEYGNQLAVAYSDGEVRLFEAAPSLPPTEWAICNHFKVAAEGGCTCLCWRGATVSDPGPLLLVGTQDRGAFVWRYEHSLMSWQDCIRLGDSDCHVACLAWAPTLGRPHEVVAIGTGSSVELWTLSGTADRHMAVDKVDTLNARAAVWKLEWNMLGTALAVSTDDGEVLVFSPNLLGKFLMTGRFVGDSNADGAKVVPME